MIKKDIEKKKEALEEEKSLIDERLQARKDAEDEAEKYEELAELKKQLASVEMDSSRTKDAAQLRKSIADLEKEIGWDIADKEADNAKNEIQDQMDAYDDYITKGDEDLEELLKDANNFSEEVNNVLKMNQSELFDWLKNNVKEYTESLKDAQQQMVNSWSDTYKQMMGLTDTYWDCVCSYDNYLSKMQQTCHREFCKIRLFHSPCASSPAADPNFKTVSKRNWVSVRRRRAVVLFSFCTTLQSW